MASNASANMDHSVTGQSFQLIGDQQPQPSVPASDSMSVLSEHGGYTVYKHHVQWEKYLTAFMFQIITSAQMFVTLEARWLEGVFTFLSALDNVFKINKGIHHPSMKYTDPLFTSWVVENFTYLDCSPGHRRKSLMLERFMVHHCFLDRPIGEHDSLITARHLHHPSAKEIIRGNQKYHGKPMCSSQVLSDYSYYRGHVKHTSHESQFSLRDYLDYVMEDMMEHNTHRVFAPSRIGILPSVADIDSFKVEKGNESDKWSYWKVIDDEGYRLLRNGHCICRPNRSCAQHLSKDAFTAIMVAHLDFHGVNDVGGDMGRQRQNYHLVKVVINLESVIENGTNDIKFFTVPNKEVDQAHIETSLKVEFDVEVIHVISHYRINYNPWEFKKFLREYGFLLHYNTFDFDNQKNLFLSIKEVLDVNGRTGYIPAFKASPPPPSHPTYPGEDITEGQKEKSIMDQDKYSNLRAQRQLLGDS